MIFSSLRGLECFLTIFKIQPDGYMISKGTRGRRKCSSFQDTSLHTSVLKFNLPHEYSFYHASMSLYLSQCTQLHFALAICNKTNLYTPKSKTHIYIKQELPQTPTLKFPFNSEDYSQINHLIECQSHFSVSSDLLQH